MDPSFLPDPDCSTEEMYTLQRRVAATATFVDRDVPAPSAVEIRDPLPVPDLPDGPLTDTGTATRTLGGEGGGPVVVGLDQAFLEGAVLGAAVAIRDGDLAAVAVARRPLTFPYVPGLLAFREARVALEAVEALPVHPSLLVVDGSGRIHYRQAGLATHLGVLLDRPAVGATKSLLCGTPTASLETPLSVGTTVPIEADDEIEAVGEAGAGHPPPDPDWPVVGHAVQTRQYDDTAARHVNPLYVSPGNRCSAGTAAATVESLAAGYKLAEPIRLADALADRAKSEAQG